MRRLAHTAITPKVLERIVALADEHGLERVVLFGSRAKDNYRKRSDIDLACEGGDFARFALDVDETTPTLLKFDFVNLDSAVRESLRAAIDAEGVVLYARAG